jgi:hypothetical protein
VAAESGGKARMHDGSGLRAECDVRWCVRPRRSGEPDTVSVENGIRCPLSWNARVVCKRVVRHGVRDAGS